MMNSYNQEFRNLLKDMKTGKQPDSILRFLEDAYLEAHPVSGEEIKKLEAVMAPVYESIPLDRSNTLFQMVYDLCGQYERAAFRTGLQVGLCLQQEISRL